MTKYGWHANKLTAYDVTIDNDLTITGDLSFGDATTDTLTVTGAATFSTDVTFTLGSSEAFTLTCTDISDPMVMTNTITSADTTGGRAKFVLAVQAAMGGWANAIKGETTFNSSGSVTGLGSVVCGDLTLSTGTSSGSYAVFEGNIIAGSSASTGTKTSFLQLNAAGDDNDTVDSNAFFLAGGANLDAGSGKFFDTDIDSHTAYGGLRVHIEGVGTKYIALVSN